jgi:nucleoside-diphosphate-sugar epimerase
VKTLVTGGNGFVGRHLVHALLERGDRVRVLALPGEDVGWLEERGASIYAGDICRQETLAAPMQAVEGVVHLAAMMDVWRPLRDYYAVNVNGTANVCKVALEAGVRRLVHMSSSSVYGTGLGRPADETFPLCPFPDPYSVTKAEGDRLVQRMIVGDRLPAVIIRPDQTFGPGDRLHFGRTADRLRAGKGIIVGPGDNMLPLVYVSDVVQGLLLALDHERAVGQAFNITNDRPLTQQQFLEAIAHAVGARPPRVHIPYHLLYAAGHAAERLATITRSKHQPIVTRLGVKLFGTDNRHAIDKARREMDYDPEVELLEGIRLAGSWYLNGAAGEGVATAEDRMVVLKTGGEHEVSAVWRRDAGQ